MNEENANLLQEELDNIPDLAKKKSLALDQDHSPGGKWMLLDVTFGIPLFDSELNKSICQGIVINGLWKSANLKAVEESGKNLCQSLNEFILKHQDLPLNESSAKTLSTPEERRKHPVPLPTRVLFFDGLRLHDKL